jgi:hypothetical protein
MLSIDVSRFHRTSQGPDCRDSSPSLWCLVSYQPIKALALELESHGSLPGEGIAWALLVSAVYYSLGSFATAFYSFTMIPMLTLLVSLTSLPWSLAKNDRQPTVGHAFFISHLSPLISYTPSTPTDDPVSGWNVSLARHSTTNASASVEFAYFGNSFDVLVANYSRLEGIDRSLTTGWHEATITTEQSDDSFMDIRSYIAYTNVPTSTE